MYEPVYLPELTEHTLAIPRFRFLIKHSAACYGPNRPDEDPLHIHPETEIFFNVSCDASFFVNGQLYPIQPGDVVVSRPGDLHMCVFHKTTVQEHFCLWIDADTDSPLFDFLRKSPFSPLLSFSQEIKDELHELFLSLAQTDPQHASPFVRTCTLLRILAVLNNADFVRHEEMPIPAELQRIVTDIRQNFASVHAVQDLASAHFISSATLTRWFRHYFHTSPRDYLESVRLSNAISLLNRGATVTEACMQSGFSDCSHFIALFKKKFGKTPLQYKKDVRRQS